MGPPAQVGSGRVVGLMVTGFRFQVRGESRTPRYAWKKIQATRNAEIMTGKSTYHHDFDHYTRGECASVFGVIGLWWQSNG